MKNAKSAKGTPAPAGRKGPRPRAKRRRPRKLAWFGAIVAIGTVIGLIAGSIAPVFFAR